ncbi:hypothetical protein GCM10009551_086750 [Nocardiopsis tropica]|uniref:hypothetical protein n=1 Tax=Tsukamurella strandjordii TaxID=147577 RepID=UPI0031D62A41
MSAESIAWDHVQAFRRHEGRPDMTRAEAKLEDLRALRTAVEESIRELEARPRR